MQKYKDSDVEVVRKDGIILLREMAAEVKNFMDFKMNAVMVSKHPRSRLMMMLLMSQCVHFHKKTKHPRNFNKAASVVFIFWVYHTSGCNSLILLFGVLEQQAVYSYIYRDEHSLREG